jgi:hypothetical protein
MSFTFDHRAGRFVAVRIESHLTLEGTQQFRTKMWTTLAGLTGKAVLCGDLLHAEMFSPEVAEALLTMLRTDNPKVERTGFILGSATFALQIERMVADAAVAAQLRGQQAPTRRTFRDPGAMRVWLEEVLAEPAERAHLAEFIATLRW